MLAPGPAEMQVYERDQSMPDPEPFDHNPMEWTEWDFRAYAEKDRRKRRELRAWNLERQDIGRFEYLLVHTLPQPHHRAASAPPIPTVRCRMAALRTQGCRSTIWGQTN